MMRRLVLLVILLFPAANAAVRFEGNDRFRQASLLDLYQRSAGLEQFISMATESYLNEGYFRVQIGEKITGADTVFIIAEGRCFEGADLRIEGLADSVASTLLASAPRTEPLSRPVLEQLTQRLVQQFADDGYPFAQAEIASLSVADSVVDVTFLLVTGPQVTVGRIDFPGIRNTKPEPLRRRISLSSGAVYCESDLTASRKTLSQLRYCYPTGEATLTYESRNRVVNVALPLRDERNLAFEGLVYLNPGNSVAGQVDIRLANAFGRGEEAGFFWSKQNRLSKRLRLSLLAPYVADYPLDLRGTLSQEDRDSSFAGTTAAVGGEYHLNNYWSLGAGFHWDKITPEENQPSPAARVIAVDLNMQFDDRDDIRQTRRGTSFAQHFVSAYRKSFPVGGGVTVGYSTHLDGEFKLWQPLRSSIIVYQRARFFQFTSDFDPIPIDQLTPIGGAESLRGFRENSYLARRGVLSATELRWYAAGNLRLHLFSDNGYINVADRSRRLSGFGAGMVVTTTAGAFQFDLSSGEEKKFNAMLVHLGFAGKL